MAKAATALVPKAQMSTMSGAQKPADKYLCLEIHKQTVDLLSERIRVAKDLQKKQCTRDKQEKELSFKHFCLINSSCELTLVIILSACHAEPERLLSQRRLSPSR